MGSGICKSININTNSSRRSDLKHSRFDPKELKKSNTPKKARVQPFPNKLASQNTSYLNHTKSVVSVELENEDKEFLEELNCTYCKTDNQNGSIVKNIVTGKGSPFNDKISISPMEERKPEVIYVNGIIENSRSGAWNENCAAGLVLESDESSTRSQTRQTESKLFTGEVVIADNRIPEVILTTNFGDNASDQEVLYRSVSTIPLCSDVEEDPEEDIINVGDKDFDNDHDDPNLPKARCSSFDQSSERKLKRSSPVMGHASSLESVNNIFALSDFNDYLGDANDNINGYHFDNDVDDRCNITKEHKKCNFCDFVKNGASRGWSDLDKDVSILMETVDKLSTLLAEKDLVPKNDSTKNEVIKIDNVGNEIKQSNPEMVASSFDSTDEIVEEKKVSLAFLEKFESIELKEKVQELRKKRQVGISLMKTVRGKQLMVFSDGKNTYQIHVAKPQPGDSTKQGMLPARSQGTITTQNDKSAVQASPSGGLNLTVKDPSGAIHLSPSRSRTSLASLEQISPGVDTLEVCDKAAARLRELANHLEHGDIPNSVLQKTLQYAAYVLDTVSMDETRRSELNRQKPLRPRSNSHIETSPSTKSVPPELSSVTVTATLSRPCPSSSKLSSAASSSSSSPSTSPLPPSSSLSCAGTVSTSDSSSSLPRPPRVDTTTAIVTTTTTTTTSTSDSSSLVKTVPKSKVYLIPPPPSNSNNKNKNNSVQKSDSVKRVILDQVDPKSGQIDEAESHQPQTNDSQDSLQRRLLDEEDELAEVQPDAVPNEVRAWLASTFTSTAVAKKPRSDDKPKFRSVANAIRAGIMVDRIYRSLFTTSSIQIPSEVSAYLKGVDNWSFDVFAMNEICPGKVLRNLSAELLTRYGLVHRFKIPTSQLDSFLSQIELGYQHYSNPYHNNLHAADVTQTVHYSLWVTGLAQWLTELEVLATIVAAIIHDYKHTGTTNNFHIMSGSAISLLYNDRSVLENYHISEAFQVICKGESNIVVNLSKEEYREFRTLIIEMVIATDMSTHFQQVKNLKTLLNHTEFAVDKQKGLSYILHSADISHPSKVFNLHQKWTLLLMEEFFRQGDMEQELGLPYSPLCDRNSTLIPQSQIGFIDFIVYPTLELCGDLMERVHDHINSQQQLQMQSSVTELDPEDQVQGRSQSSLENGASNPSKPANGSGPNTLNPPSRNASSAPAYSRCSAPVILFKKPHRPWLKQLEENKNLWQTKAAEEAKRMAMLAEQNKDADADAPTED